MMKYYLLVISTCLFWAGSFIVGKVLVTDTTPITLTILRWSIVVICLIPIVYWREKTIVPVKKAFLPLVIMGVTGVLLFNLFQFQALQQTTASNVGLIATLNMVSIAICSAIFLGERMNRYQILSMMLALFGVLIVLVKGDVMALLQLQFYTGDLWMVAAVCMWGIYTVSSKWAMRYVTPFMATLYAGIFGLLFALPFSVGSFSIGEITFGFIAGILYIGVFATVICTIFWNIGVQKLGATTAGVFLNYNALFIALLAFIFLGEAITLLQVVGSVLAMTGCYLFARFAKWNALVKEELKKTATTP